MRNLSYCSDPFLYQRRQTREVMVGNVGIGGANPIRVQSMITCDTMDTEMSIQQTMELAKVGCEIVRITAPTVKDARNPREFERALHHAKGRVTVTIQNTIGKRAVIGADAHGDAALLAKIHKWRETLPNSG